MVTYAIKVLVVKTRSVLSLLTSTESLCTLQDDGTTSRHHTSVNGHHSKVCMNRRLLSQYETDRCWTDMALDISAAFDASRTNHSLLFQRLEHTFGMIGSALDWLRSFLSGRSQYVAAGGERSVTAPCESGVFSACTVVVLTICCSCKQHCRSPSCQYSPVC